MSLIYPRHNPAATASLHRSSGGLTLTSSDSSKSMAFSAAQDTHWGPPLAYTQKTARQVERNDQSVRQTGRQGKVVSL